MEKIRVLIVDDSAIVREILKTRFSAHPQIQVVATAADPYIARNVIEREKVDVLTLDIEMPRMDGLTFLEHLMRDHPLPVIVVSSLAEKNSRDSLRALELGAVDIVAKPGGPFSIEEMVEVLIQKVLACRGLDSRKLVPKPRESIVPGIKLARSAELPVSRRLIAVGASTGGTHALETLFRGFEADFPPTLAVIHMPEKFTKTFAARLNDLVPMRVKEAEQGERLVSGTIYIAPGNFHMTLRPGENRTLKISDGPRLFGQRPSVDLLFDSVAEVAGPQCTAALLTGMGKDGAKGLARIQAAGGFTMAQDEATSVVFGMPKEAILLGAADEVLPLGQISSRIKTWTQTDLGLRVSPPPGSRGPALRHR